MRIGIIAPPWLAVPPVSYGGIEAMVGTLATTLAAAGHDVVLAAPSDSTCPVARAAGFRPSEVEAMGQTVEELCHVVNAYAALDGVDVIHDHTVVGPFHGAHSTRSPIVVTAHAPFTPKTLDIFRTMPARTSIVAISRHQASTAAGVSISRVIHHGMNAAPARVGAGHGGYACFLGRMSPDKGVAEAIRIARMAGVPLRIAGRVREPLEREYFSSVVSPMLGSDIEFLGELGSAEKYSLLGEAIALLNPIQWNEPFGLVMIEALAVGTPVVASRRASAPEIVDEGITGFLGDDEASLAVALRNAPGLDRHACRHAVETRFSAERMAQDHLDLYGSLLSLPPLRRRTGELPTSAAYR